MFFIPDVECAVNIAGIRYFPASMQPILDQVNIYVAEVGMKVSFSTTKASLTSPGPDAQELFVSSQ